MPAGLEGFPEEDLVTGVREGSSTLISGVSHERLVMVV